MRVAYFAMILAGSVATGLALGQQVALLRDLDSLSPITLSRAELQRVLARAAMSRTTANGSVQRWTNESDGTFVISSSNRPRSGLSYSAPGRWHVSEDGRYCVLIEWRVSKTEEWCRFVIRTSAGYYTVRSVKTGAEPVYPISIGG